MAEHDGYRLGLANISETHLKTTHRVVNINTEGYSIFRLDRLKRCGGGVAVVVAHAFTAEGFPVENDSRDLELFLVQEI